MLFFNKVKNEDETLRERIIKIEKRLVMAENDIISQGMGIDSLRNSVLRKIQTRKDKEEAEEDTKDLYNGMLIKTK